MSSIGDMLLKLRGYTDPRSALISSMLGGGAGGPGTPPGAVAPGAPGSPPGVPTPPGTPPLAAAYASPPDLMSLYSQLTDYQTRQHRIDSGLGLLAGSLVQPQHTGLVAQAFGDENQQDPLALILQLQGIQQQRDKAGTDAASKTRMEAMVPGIAKEYGITEDAVRIMLEGGTLDSFLSDASKPDTEIITDDATGEHILVDKKDGHTISKFATGLKPDKLGVRTIEDKKTGTTMLVDDVGKVVASFDTGTVPTEIAKEFADTKAAGGLPEGVTSLAEFMKWKANLKDKADTEINIDTSSDKLAEALDKPLADAVTGTKDNLSQIDELQSARSILNSSKGVVTGSVLSGVTSEGRKLMAQVFGLSDEAANNTDVLMAQMKNMVLPKLKELRPVSDTDLKMVEAVVGGSQALTAPVINQLIDIQEKMARKQIDVANSSMQKRIDAEKDPAKKAKLQATFDAVKVNIPAYDDAFMAHINPDDIAELKKAPTPGNVKLFNNIYGPGAAEQLLGG